LDAKHLAFGCPVLLALNGATGTRPSGSDNRPLYPFKAAMLGGV